MTQPIHLPYDVARCHGGDCRLKENCKRFLANSEGLRVVVMMDLPYESPESCGYQIETKEEWQTENVRVSPIQGRREASKTAVAGRC